MAGERFDRDSVVVVTDCVGMGDVEGARKAGWEAVLIDRPKTDLWAAVRALSGSRKSRRAR